jgi:hypothetical protein
VSVCQKDSSAYCYDNICVSVVGVVIKTSFFYFFLLVSHVLINKLVIVSKIDDFVFSTHILRDFYLEWSLYESEPNTLNYFQDNFRLLLSNNLHVIIDVY